MLLVPLIVNTVCCVVSCQCSVCSVVSWNYIIRNALHVRVILYVYIPFLFLVASACVVFDDLFSLFSLLSCCSLACGSSSCVYLFYFNLCRRYLTTCRFIYAICKIEVSGGWISIFAKFYCRSLLSRTSLVCHVAYKHICLARIDYCTSRLVLAIFGCKLLIFVSTDNEEIGMLQLLV